MPRRYSRRHSQKSHTLILILVSAAALFAAFGAWKITSLIREYQVSRDAYDDIILETSERYAVDPALVKDYPRLYLGGHGKSYARRA